MTSQKTNQNILITGSRAPIALELARSFALHGHRVVMADSLRLTIARWSSSTAKYYYLPPPRYEIEAYVKTLQEIIQKENIAHLIPTCEEAIFIAFHKEKFNCKVWTPDKQSIVDLHNKYTFCQKFKTYLPIPTTILLKDFIDWDNGQAYVFKQVYSRFATSAIIAKQVTPTNFANENKNNWVAQKYIKGKEICVYSIWDNGTQKAYAAYHPLYRAGKGAGIYFEPIFNNEVFDIVQAFGTTIHYTGQLCFDVIIGEDNKPYFIECNPRGTSGAHLLHSELANCFLGTQPIVVNDDTAYSIKYAMAIYHLIDLFKKKVRLSKDVIYRSDDKKPFFYQALSLLEILYIKFTKARTLLQATTSDIEWNGDEN